MIYTFLFLSVFSVTALLGASFCHHISSYAEFEHYSKDYECERFTKCVLDLQQNKLFYFDVNEYPMHVDFIIKKLLTEPFCYEEYVKNYTENKPNFLFCYVIYQKKQNLWTLALWEGDKATKEDITKAYNAIASTFYEGDKLYFRPTSTYQEDIAKTLANIPVVTNDELFRQSDYQLLNAATGVGILRIAKDSSQYAYNDDEIIILPELIPDITPVAGIITEQFSTPLSHLALRARAWGIPHAGIKEATTMFKELEGKYVFFKTSLSGYEVRLATANEFEEYQSSRKKPTNVVLANATLNEQRLKPLQQLRRAHHTAYGTKAANLGEASVDRVAIPDGFAIPFYYYDAHVKACGAFTDIQLYPHNLEAIQEKIRTYPLEKSFLDAVWAKLPSTAVFVRSSTNAEDLAGFNGAGLYETVANVKTIEELEVAIKTVWASIWCHKAYKERERYGIDHKTVYGAVLIQASVDATAAGVLATKDIFDPAETMEVYTINAMHGLGIGVVDGMTIPEQIIYNFDNKGIKIISRASGGTITVCNENGGTKRVPNPSHPVLTDDQVTALGNAAHRIIGIFKAQQPLDIEWLFKDNTLYIVQVRPFI